MISRPSVLNMLYRTEVCRRGSWGRNQSLAEHLRRHQSTSRSLNGKPRVVVLGSGWASVFFIKNLSAKKFDLTVVSPRNYFNFTPLLPKILSGMANANTASEPIVGYIKRYFKNNASFVHATCVDVDTEANSLTCVPVDNEGPQFSVNYDYLVIGVGATSNTFGTPGVEEYGYFLKEVEHAEVAFQKVLDNFRLASMPYVSEEDKRRLLHFVVVGGGPTGVESTGELSVLMNKHLTKMYPELVPYMKVSIVEGGSRLLPSMAQSTSRYVSKVFDKNNVNTYFGKVVSEVKKNSCVLKERATGKTEEIECGMVLWASGLKENELVRKLLKKWECPDNTRGLLVDQYLRLKGTDNVFCLGDCSKISPTKLSENVELVLEKVGKPTVQALVSRRKAVGREFPQVRDYKWKFKEDKFKNAVNEIVAKYGGESKESFVEVLKHIDQNYVPPFPTAQNAKQEAVYLSKMFNNGSVASKNYKDSAFSEEWNGTLASLGGPKVIINTPHFNINGGPIPFLMWNAVYLMMFSSCRMRASFLFDLILSFTSDRQIAYKRYKD